MKFLFFILIVFSSIASGVDKYGYLTPEDQKYYKNDNLEGNNQRERIDSLVIEINKLHGQISSLKSEVQQLKSEIDKMKKEK